MRDAAALKKTLAGLDGKGYGSYRQLQGTYDLGSFRLTVDRTQVDPYAPPSLMRVTLDAATAGLPAHLISNSAGRTAVSDYLIRRFAEAIPTHTDQPSGTGGAVSIGRPLQQVLQRTSVVIFDDRVEARIAVGLPASGRRIRGHHASRILAEQLPRIVEDSLIYANVDADALDHHVTLYRDQEDLRTQLADKRLVAFVGEGAILPRRSGDSDEPMREDAVEFTSPESLRVEFSLPSGRHVAGMGIPEGVTVIVGGGYHGKSTLLRGLERGVYSHIAGDGREWVITRSDATSIRAEDGRAVTGVDISAFISGLPSGADTAQFATPNASGSTSQAANLAEAVEAGATALLIDEDTSATNFMIRDQRMRQLIAADREPITPFIDRVRPLYTQRGVSTVLVAGGSGAFFDVADQVIALDAYVPRDVTAEARRIAGREHPQEAPAEEVFTPTAPRVPAAATLSPANKNKAAKARASTVLYGRDTVDLSAVSQLVDPAQTQGIAHAMDRLAEIFDGQRNLSEAIEALDHRIDQEGLDVLSAHHGHPGAFARPRIQEIYAAVNRYRRLKLS